MSTLFPMGCIIMASGHSARFGSNKLLQDFQGQPLIQYILTATQDIFAQRVVVTRYEKIARLCQEQHMPYLLHDKPYLNDTVRLAWPIAQRLHCWAMPFAPVISPFYAGKALPSCAPAL